MSDDPLLIRLMSVGSTNTFLKQLVADGDPNLREGMTVAAVAQTAGRGQRGNSWESDPGCNVTISVLLEPVAIHPARQFAVSEVVALATASTVDRWLPAGMSATVKWPNDIYVGDRKIAGILIENSLSGPCIRWSVCGIGLNVNQPAWHSDAPNPVALRELCGTECDRDAVESALRHALISLSSLYLGKGGDLDSLHALYLSRLWRGKGVHPWVDTASGKQFDASVATVAPTGHITLRLSDGEQRTYAFKEVAAVIGQ